MKTILTTLASLLALTAFADAKTFKIGDPVLASVSLPDGWKPSAIKGGGAQATSDDGDLYFAVEPMKGSDVEANLGEALQFVIDQGVKMDPSTTTKYPFEINGMKALEITMQGKNKDGGTDLVDLVAYYATPKMMVVLTGWGTPAGFKKYGNEVASISQSIAPAK